jgi:threonine aldolase
VNKFIPAMLSVGHECVIPMQELGAITSPVKVNKVDVYFDAAIIANAAILKAQRESKTEITS